MLGLAAPSPFRTGCARVDFSVDRLTEKGALAASNRIMNLSACAEGTPQRVVAASKTRQKACGRGGGNSAPRGVAAPRSPADEVAAVIDGQGWSDQGQRGAKA